MRRPPSRFQLEDEDAHVPGGEFQFSGFAEYDCARGGAEVEVAGGETHAVAADFFAYDEEEGDSGSGDGAGGDEAGGGVELGCYAGLCVDGAAAGDEVGVGAVGGGGVRVEGGNGVDVGC